MNTVSNFYVIRDALAEGFGVPFVQSNDYIAVRAFMRLLDDPQSDLHASPKDYQLIKIGTYDFRTGMIQSCDHVIIKNGSDYKAD